MANSARQITQQIDAVLAQEQGAFAKVAPLRIALAYPSPYHVGMSSLGFQQIYRIVNQLEGVSAERTFLPDDTDLYRNQKIPIFTWESKRPLSDVPMVAFSVAYELELVGLVQMMDLAGIPALREERDESHPLIVAGGPLTFSNPTPLEPFVDVLVQGEADQLIVELMQRFQDSENRESLLADLAKQPGFLIPKRGGTRFFVSKADDAKLPARSAIVTPNTELRSMFLIEPERGCSRGCQYCVMRRTTNGGMRTVQPEKVLSLIPDFAKRVGLVGAAVTDHPRIVSLLQTIVDSGREVGVSSLRAERLNLDLVAALRKGGARVLTVASDGASQKMRNFVDRKHTEKQLIHAAQLAKEVGMARLKVYNMVGVPFEDESDIDELVRFTLELSKIIPVALGVAPFVAKRNTPMDGAPFAGIKEVESRLARLRKGLKGRAELRPVSARWAWVEYMLAQSDEAAGLAAMDAARAGGSFAAWKKAFAERGVQPFMEKRVADQRRDPVLWPVVGAGSAA